ncbi:TRAP transporter substrate-binding protein DctP [Pelagibius sp. Alg239-R121]|uniref:TRAP transporter substrate-binding protein DctP n=1 Tax=Pelagibius sp. Alg239-R121 TaxID=2993448 RepID=UPI0024A66110|nr:TRAP transporter substrate-binding protein DctP [Pelagibius sp. Alg239-R121]
MKKRILFFISLVMSVPSLVANAQEVDLTMVMIPGPGSIYSQSVLQVPERVSKATDGRVKITINNSLVKGTQLAPSVRDGRTQMSAVLHPYLSSGDPRMGLSHLPGLIENIEEYKFVWDAFYGKLLADIWLEKWNSVVLAEGAFCTQNLWSKTPIQSIEDFKGKKIRVNNTESAHLLNALGAKPTPIAWGEIPSALDRGLIDGIMSASCAGYQHGFGRVTKYLQNWKTGPIVGWAILVNKDVWAEVPADLQQMIKAEMWSLQEESFHSYYEYQTVMQEKIEADGAQFWVAPDNKLEELFVPKYTDAVYETWYKRADELGVDGKALVKRVRAVLGK